MWKKLDDSTISKELPKTRDENICLEIVKNEEYIIIWVGWGSFL